MAAYVRLSTIDLPSVLAAEPPSDHDLYGRSEPSCRGCARWATYSGRTPILTNSILLGRGAAAPALPVGFHSPTGGANEGGLVTYDGDGPLLTIAPTGAGKGLGYIIPNLLSYAGPIICTDPKGENAAVTASRRVALGQKVLLLDPFGVSDRRDAALRGGLNPLDLINKDAPHAIDDALSLATSMIADPLTVDPHWAARARQIMVGVILFVAAYAEPADRHLGMVRKLIVRDMGGLAETLAAMIKSRLFGGRIADSANILLSMPDRERGSVLSTLGRDIDFVGSPHVTASLSSSDVQIEDLITGATVSIYMIVPPERLESHRALLRLWLTTMLTAFARRKTRPDLSTLMLVDECGQLGRIPHLSTAVTLMRGYGLQPWLFFQDCAQMRSAYPTEWPTFLTNSHCATSCGFRTSTFCREIADTLGFDGPPLLGSNDNAQLIALNGTPARLGQRLNYLADPEFQGLWRPNPMFGNDERKHFHGEPHHQRVPSGKDVARRGSGGRALDLPGF